MRVAHDPDVESQHQPADDSRRVAAALLAHHAVVDCTVLTRQTTRGIVELLAYVVPASGFAIQDLRDRLQSASLPLPSQFVPVSSIPLTADGFIDAERLSRLAVSDAAMLDEWETRAQSVAGIGKAAVVVDATTSPSLPLHLSHLLPEWSARPRAIDQQVPAVVRSAQIPSSSSLVPAIVDGGVLDADADVVLTLGDALDRAAATSSHGVVYVGLDGSATAQPYAELLANATRILGGLQALGLKTSDRVIFQLERHQDFIETFWACVLGGFLPVPLAVPASYDRPSPPMQTLQKAWPTLDMPHIVTTRRDAAALTAAAERLELTGARVHAVEDLRAVAYGRRHASAPDDLAILMLTSGSTGTPKAVMLTHRNVLTRTAGSRQLNGFSDREVTLNWMPLDHVAGLIYFHLRDVCLGCRQVHVPTASILQDPLLWLDALDRYRATITFAPNFAFALVNDRERELAGRSWDLSCVRLVLNGAEAIVARTARRFLALLEPHGLGPACMHPAWGMSETSSGVIYGDRFSLATSTDDDAFVEVGRPIPTLSMRIVDDEDHVVGEGIVGRLQVKGAVVTPGYFGNDALTRDSFTPDGWFKTGDFGTIRDRRLTITGREKDVVIINSVNYYCHEIESVVETIDGVEPTLTAACPVRPDGAETDRLAIFFHAADPHLLPELLSRIRAEVTAKIGIAPDYLLPVDAAAIPKTSLGKIQRSELARQFAAGAFGDVLEQVDRLTANANTIPDWFFRKVWRRKGGVRDRTALDGATALLFVDRQPFVSDLRTWLEASGVRSVAVQAASAFGRIGPAEYAVNPREPGDYVRLLDAMAEAGHTPTHVLHLWGCGADAGVATGDAVERAQFTGALSALALAQALARRAASGEVSLTVVASHAQRVHAGDRVACEKAPAIGILKSLPQEMPWLRCRHVDLGASDPNGSIAAIVGELHIRQDDREVAYRDGDRFVAGLEKAAFDRDAPRTSPFTRGGTYLVTGGAGGIGERLAALLVDRFDANLLLVGRSALDDARRELLRRLSAMGGRVAYEAVDVCDEARLTAIVDRYTAEWERSLDGVIHLAGIYDERLLADETPDHILAMLAPKARGADVLHRLLTARGGGVFVASSSIAGFFGGASIGAYAAANAFQEAFADAHREDGTVRHYCFSWSNWSEVGQSRGYQLKDSPRARGYQAMPADRALQSLLVGLTFAEPALLVGLDGANRHIRRHLAEEPDALETPILYYTSAAGARAETALRALDVRDRFGRRSRAEVMRIAEMPATDAGHIDRDQLLRLGRARGERTFVAPRTATERRVAEIWRALLGVSAVGCSDNFFDLGGDSLLAARLVAQLQQACSAGVSLRTIFDAPTLADLAAAVDTQGLAAAEPCVAAPTMASATRPLSPGQRALWLLHQIAPASSAYNIAFTARVVSPVDAGALRRAFQGLIDRHDALRTLFPAVQGEPSRLVLGVLDAPLDVVDASSWSADAVLDEIARETKRPFDLATGPLLRIRLYTRERSLAFLTATFHHIVMDGWSLWVCLSEVAELYRAALLNEPPQLTAAVNDDGGRARWQGEMATSAEGARHLAYWKQHLGDDVPVLNLPTDRARPAIPRYRGASENFRIGRGTTEHLKRLARGGRATPQMTMLALLGALLQRYSGQESLMIGYLSSGRSRPELESIVGYLGNLLPLRLRLPPASTFGEALKRTRDTLLASLDHEDYPFSLLVDRVSADREPSRSPLFQVLFVYEKPQLLESEYVASFIAGMPGARMSLGDLQLESLAFPVQQEGQFDLTLMVVEVNGELCFTIDYNTDLFDGSTIRRMGGHLQTLAESAAGDPDRAVATLPMLSSGERGQLRAWNDVRAGHGAGCVHAMIEAHAAAHPDALAVASGDARLTYQQLDARATDLARDLRRAGVTTGTVVGLLFERSSIDLVVGMLGVLKAGGAFLPLDRSHPPDRLSFMLRDSGAPVLLTESALVDLIPSFAGCTMTVKGLSTTEDTEDTEGSLYLPSSASSASSVWRVAPDDLAYIIYTSGSTGRPKGVQLAHRGLWNVAREQQRVFGPGPGTRVLQFASLSFDACVFETVMALGSGASLHLASRESLLPGLPLLQTLKSEGITNLTIPPSALANLPLDPLPALDTLMVAGEACPPELVARWAPGRRFFNLYGPTEATIWSTCAECTDGARLPPIGVPIANTQAYVLDANLQELPVGVPGELHLGGVGLARGYINQPELAADRFIRSPFASDPRERLYRTGDIVRRAEDGQLHYLGRVDTQVKLRGFRIELGEIEAALGRHPDVKQAVALVRDDPDTNRRLVGYVEASRPIAASALKKFLHAHVPDYMVPAVFVVMDEFPLNTSGKVDRGALPVPDPARQVDEAYAPPTGEIQQRIADVWHEVLRVDRVGADDNFFDLGGNSLLVARVHARLAEIEPSALSIVDMFQFPTVRQLANHLMRDSRADDANRAAAGRGDALVAGRARLREQARRRGDAPADRMDGSR
jgi:amino acid adenylation domain-containing protein